MKKIEEGAEVYTPDGPGTIVSKGIEPARLKIVLHGSQRSSWYSRKQIANDPRNGKWAFCNHHHEPTVRHKMVDFGDGPFVANVDAMPLLVALNKLGLRTRTHHIDKKGAPHAFVSILLDKGVRFEVKEVFESDAARTKYNGQHELLISWDLKDE